MGELIRKESNELVAWLHNDDQKDLPKPFENKIYLYSTHVVGTQYVEEPDKLSSINTDDVLELYRESDNHHDQKAIVVRTKDGVKVGYIPRYDNAVFSRLMDAGKRLYAVVTYTRSDFESGYGRYIDISIYMED